MNPHNPNSSNDAGRGGDSPSGGLPIVPVGGESRLALRAGVPATAAPPSSLDVMALLKAFRRCWPIAVGVGILCSMAAVAAAWYGLPPSKYVSRATLQITSYVPKIIFTPGEAGADPQTYQRTQMTLLRNRMVLNNALVDPKIVALPTVAEKDDPVEWLEKDLQVNAMSGSMIVEVSLQGDRAVDLAPILNAVVDSYMHLIVDEEKKDRITRLDYLRKLWSHYVDELKTKRKMIREMVETVGPANNQEALALRQDYLYQSLTNAQIEQRSVHQHIQQLEATLKVLEAAKAKQVQALAASASARPALAAAPGQAPPSASSYPEGFGDDDATINSIRSHMGMVKRQYDDARGRARRGHNDAAALHANHELEVLQHDLDQRLAYLAHQAQVKASRPQDELANDPVAEASNDPIQGAKIQIQSLRLYEVDLLKDIDDNNQRVQDLNINAIDMKSEQTEADIIEETAHKIRTEIQSVEVELQAPQRVTIRDRAREPKFKDESKKIKMTGMAGLGAFGLAVFGITFMEYRARRIGSTDEVVQNLGLRLVGSLPLVPIAPRRRVLSLGRSTDDQWQSRLVESVDATRTMLLHASRTDGIRVVMITSALKGEGKTSLSGHLATSLARSGRKTLLIDCDLRKPDAHRLFDVLPDPGLCDVLRGETDALAAVQPTAAPDLYVMSAGRCDPLALQALAQDGARAVFDSLLHEYDFIIVDSAPVLPVADSLLLSQQVDAVLFSILQEVSCVPHVQNAYERVSGLGARVLGAVVSGTPSHGYGYKGYPTYG